MAILKKFDILITIKNVKGKHIANFNHSKKNMNNLLLTLHSPIVQYTRNVTFIYLSAILDQFHVLKTGR